MPTPITYKNAGKQEFLQLVRALVRAYQAFSAVDADGHRAADLTISQADVLFALGNTEGLNFKEIGEKTLITKGTLTGVVDRLEKKRLVRRVSNLDDKRCTVVRLTDEGRLVFQQHFPRHIRYLKSRFERLSRAERETAVQLLEKLASVL